MADGSDNGFRISKTINISELLTALTMLGVLAWFYFGNNASLVDLVHQNNTHSEKLISELRVLIDNSNAQVALLQQRIGNDEEAIKQGREDERNFNTAIGVKIDTLTSAISDLRTTMARDHR